MALLEILSLNDNSITGLRAGEFGGLTSLEYLLLSGNQLTVLPGGILDSLSSLLHLELEANQLAELPSGIFDGLTEALLELHLGGNTVNPMNLTVLLELLENLQIRAVIPAGAPFDIVLPLTLTDGSIAGGATTLTFSAGDTESPVVTVEAAENATDDPTVSIGALPGIPTEHSGYQLFQGHQQPSGHPESRAWCYRCDPQQRPRV